MPDREREAEERVWLENHRDVARRALEAFLASGEWPAISPLQRDIDRAGESDDVALAIAAIPARPGELRRWQPTVATIPMRILWHLPEARPLIESALRLVVLAYEAYMSDTEDPAITSDDFVGEDASAQALLAQAGRLLGSDYPNPFGGGSWGDEWRLQVNDALARRLGGISTPEEYFEWQDDLLDEADRERVHVERQGAPVASLGRGAVVDVLRAAQVGHVSDRLVLLGAGASVEAGMPESLSSGLCEKQVSRLMVVR